jgi:hypothetical protein
MRVVAALAVTGVMIPMAVTPAGAIDPSYETVPFHYTVNATTTMKKLNQTITVPPGTFSGVLAPATGELEGHITLPPATFTMEVAGIGLVTATAKIKETGPVTGMIDFRQFPNLPMTATSTFTIRIVSAYAPGIDYNLVGPLCITREPVSVTMNGEANLSGPSTLSGTYTIPPFHYCNNVVVTQALNLLVAGDGNTFTATATP